METLRTLPSCPTMHAGDPRATELHDAGYICLDAIGFRWSWNGAYRTAVARAGLYHTDSNASDPSFLCSHA